MNHAIVTNIPENPLEILEEALKVSFRDWIDEKGSKKHPSVWKRQKSDLTFKQAFDIIQNSKPHWVFSFRNMSTLTSGLEKDYWDFGGTNIGNNDYGEVYIWIHLTVEEAEKIFKKHKLKIKWY